jgi:hypothetical protein
VVMAKNITRTEAMCNQERLRIFIPIYSGESDKKHLIYLEKLKELNGLQKINEQYIIYYGSKIRELMDQIKYYEKRLKDENCQRNKKIDKLIIELSDAGY